MTAAIARGLVIAAPRSGSGKTILTLGLMRAFHRTGLAVSGAKCGPDYIDPAFHAAATRRPSVNLDSWAMRPAILAALAARTAEGCDLIICEGSMGLFDGVPGAPGRTGTSADVAKALGWPVLLVLDVSGQSQSAAAIVKGCMTYDPNVRIAGVVLNRVASQRHQRLVCEAIDGLGVKILGALPRATKLVLPERHLGLVQAEETAELGATLDAIADFVSAHVDLAGVRSLAEPLRSARAAAIPAIAPPAQRIALARDAAFSFIYPHIIEHWRSAGAEIRLFSPLADEAPPEICDLCWLPGGYPELHAGRLSAAAHFLEGLRGFAHTRPIHGECGGYMVLGQTLTDAEGQTHPMAGLLGLATSFSQRKMQLGYRDAELLFDGPLGKAGTRLKGHEFHYATIASRGDDDAFALINDVYGSEPLAAGNRRGLVSGSFFHLIIAEDAL
ncbi:MAG: cobyrinate a,c-diamide synthase [Beijerinckiaceae bacterium]